MSSSAVFPDENRIRDLAERIRARCAQAQQLKLSGQQAPGNLQVAQAEEIQKRLTETVFRLQEAVRDFSLVGVQRRLELTSQKLSLKLDVQRTQQGLTSFFLSSDAFFIEICCRDNGHVVSVKLVQGHNQQEDSELFARLLRDHQFSELEAHLKALTELYAQAGLDKVNVFQALSATERVLLSISERSPHSTLSEVIMTNPLGHVTPRSGGLPMVLTFFVPPSTSLRFPLLSSPDKTASLPPGVGLGGRVVVEKTTQSYPLSINPNLFNQAHASFYPVTTQNSVRLAVTFVLELSSSLPLCVSVAEKLHKAVYGTDQDVQPLAGVHINELIARNKAEKEKKEMCRDKCRLVCLPGQNHYYYVPPELALPPMPSPPHPTPLPPGDPARENRGLMLSKVPFTHPGHVLHIIPLLRKQLVYNTLLGSCLGRSSKNTSPDPSAVEYIFDVATSPPDKITVVMDTQSGKEEEKITVEFLLPDQQPTQPVVSVRVGGQTTPLTQPQLSQITKRCLSIPVSLHAALTHPSLLGPTAATIVQSYQREVGSELGQGAGGRTRPELQRSESGRTALGVKRKWTD